MSFLSSLPCELRHRIWSIFYTEICPPRIICNAAGEAIVEDADPQPDGHISRPLSAVNQPVSISVTYYIHAAPAMTCKTLYVEVWSVIWANLQLHLTRNAHASNHHDFSALPFHLVDKIRHIFWYATSEGCYRDYGQDSALPLPLWTFPNLETVTICWAHHICVEDLPIGDDLARTVQENLQGCICAVPHDIHDDPQSLLHYPTDIPKQLPDMRLFNESLKAVERYRELSPQGKIEQWLFDPEEGESLSLLRAMISTAVQNSARSIDDLDEPDLDTLPRQSFMDKLWRHMPGTKWGRGDWINPLMDSQWYQGHYEDPMIPRSLQYPTKRGNDTWKIIMRNSRVYGNEQKGWPDTSMRKRGEERKEGLKKLTEFGKRVSVRFQGEMRLSTALTSRSSVPFEERAALDPSIEGGTMLLDIVNRPVWKIVGARQMGAQEYADRKRLGLTAFTD